MNKEKIVNSFRTLYKMSMNFILPPRCPSCGDLTNNHHQLCVPCWSQLTFISEPTCPLCGVPLPYIPMNNNPLEQKIRCASCLIQIPTFNTGCSSFVYKGLIRKLVLRFKHGDATYLAPLFAKWLFNSSHKYLKECDYIIPIPLHRWRLFNRRYNQTTLLARHLNKLSHIPILVLTLQRHKNTAFQGHKNRKERQKNVHKAFRVPAHFHEKLTGKTICLLDDVWTTGATLSTCAKVLKGAGAHKIIVLSLTRVVSDS